MKPSWRLALVGLILVASWVSSVAPREVRFVLGESSVAAGRAPAPEKVSAEFVPEKSAHSLLISEEEAHKLARINWHTSTDAIEQGLIEPPSPTLAIDLRNSIEKETDLSVEGVTATMGYTSQGGLPGDDFFVRILDTKGSVIFERGYDLPQREAAEAGLSADEAKRLTDQESVDLSRVTVAVPWRPQMARLEIVRPGAKPIPHSLEEVVVAAEETPEFEIINGQEFLDQAQGLGVALSPPSGGSGFMAFGGRERNIVGTKNLRIMIFPEDYPSAGKARQEVAEYVATVLRVEPFRTRAADIDFVTGQKGDPRILGQFDVSIVLKNVPEYRRSNTTVVYNSDPRRGYVLVHELGHIVGTLRDEYLEPPLKPTTPMTTAGSFVANCYPGALPAPGWQTLAPTSGFRLGCGRGHPDWYRTTETSIMKTGATRGEGSKFNAVGNYILNRRIDAYQGADSCYIRMSACPRDPKQLLHVIEFAPRVPTLEACKARAESFRLRCGSLPTQVFPFWSGPKPPPVDRKDPDEEVKTETEQFED